MTPDFSRSTIMVFCSSGARHSVFQPWGHLWLRPPPERNQITGSHSGRPIVEATIPFEHFGSERSQGCSAAARATRRGSHHGFGESLADAVEQQPRALVGHAHVTRGGRDRASVTDAFAQLDLAGADPRAGLKYDADPEPRHSGTVPCARLQRSFSVRDARPGSLAPARSRG